jgi:hypothetical protein
VRLAGRVALLASLGHEGERGPPHRRGRPGASGVASLGILFVSDIGTAGRIANSVGALLQFGAAALVLYPSRKS